MAETKEILWIDDDSPPKAWTAEGLLVRTAQTCKEGVDFLESGRVSPSWVIVDLIVPQAGWQKNYLKIPGLDLTEYISKQFTSRVVVYTIVADRDRRETALSRGAAFVFEKTTLAFLDLLRKLKEFDEGPSVDRLVEKGERHA